jgi:aerobic carbon-monoxide dehydrogenase small subunit
MNIFINRISHAISEPHLLLVDTLRAQGLTGTNIACDTAQCGACTVLVDGQAVKSCNVLAGQVAGCEITTVEGLAGYGALAVAGQPHPLQLAFSKHHALQCGFCTSGMLMRAAAMLNEGVPANEEAIRAALGGNLCRCTGYQGIVDAILDVMEQQKQRQSLLQTEVTDAA